MQVIRTIVWVLVTTIVVAFVSMNWTTAPVNFWPLEKSYLHFEWPVGLIALFFFLLGLLPAWVLARLTRWRYNRRIAVLENTVKAATPALAAEAATAPSPQSSPQDLSGS